jgi:DNA-directed RNA polymerase subunit RPC12/RpoP
MLSLFQALLWSLVAIPLLLLLLVLGVAITGHHSLRRSIKMASTCRCPKCGNIVGRDAVLAAKEAYGQKVREMMQQHPGVMFRLVAEWQLGCPRCSFKFYLYPNSNKIETVSIFDNQQVQRKAG